MKGRMLGSFHPDSLLEAPEEPRRDPCPLFWYRARRLSCKQGRVFPFEGRRMARIPAAALFFLAALAIAGAVAPFCTDHLPGPSAFELAEVAKVVDGDTIEVRLEDGSLRKVRLIGIDAPESVHPDESRNTEAGERAREFVASLLPPGTIVWLERDVSDIDKYGRLLRYVWAAPPGSDGRSESFLANAAIVEAGHARAKRYPPDTARADLIELAEDREAVTLETLE